MIKPQLYLNNIQIKQIYDNDDDELKAYFSIAPALKSGAAK